MSNHGFCNTELLLVDDSFALVNSLYQIFLISAVYNLLRKTRTNLSNIVGAELPRCWFRVPIRKACREYFCRHLLTLFTTLLVVNILILNDK
jgi:hypothetical protein